MGPSEPCFLSSSEQILLILKFLVLWTHMGLEAKVEEHLCTLLLPFFP